MSKISVIIPAHNEEKLIGVALESLLRQSFENFEIIVVNDGSTDNTRKIVENYILKNKKIKLLNFKKGHSAAFARNNGAKIAKGKIFIFMDADAYVNKLFLEKVHSLSDKADAFAVECLPINKNFLTFGLSGLMKIFKYDQKFYSKKDSSRPLVFNIKGDVFKKIGPYDENIFYFEDEEFSNRFYDAGYKTIYVRGAYHHSELPSSFSDFFRQCNWIGKGLNTIKPFSRRNSIKMWWIFKLFLVILPIFLVFNPHLMLISAILVYISFYLAILKRNKRPIVTLVASMLSYIKILVVNFSLLKSLFNKNK